MYWFQIWRFLTLMNSVLKMHWVLKIGGAIVFLRDGGWRHRVGMDAVWTGRLTRRLTGRRRSMAHWPVCARHLVWNRVGMANRRILLHVGLVIRVRCGWCERTAEIVRTVRRLGIRTWRRHWIIFYFKTTVNQINFGFRAAKALIAVNKFNFKTINK